MMKKKLSLNVLLGDNSASNNNLTEKYPSNKIVIMLSYHNTVFEKRTLELIII